MGEKHTAIKRRITFFAYGITAIISVILGSIYLFSPQFMPYHSAAIGVEWAVLSSETQVLYLALLRVAGGGWIGIGVAMMILLWIPYRRKEGWASGAIAAVGLIFYLPTLYATVLVTVNTPATAPWYGNVAAVASLLIGFALTRK